MGLDYDPALVSTEYSSLREEILKRTEIRYQLHALSLTAFSALISVGVSSHNALIIFVFPVVALFLAASWLSNLHDIWRISSYLMTEVEAKVGSRSLGWESWANGAAPTPDARHRLLVVSSRAMFWLTQSVAVVVGTYVGLSDNGTVAHGAVWAGAAVTTAVTAYTVTLLVRGGRRPR